MMEFSHITIRLTPKQYAWLDEQKKSTGNSWAATIRLLIENHRAEERSREHEKPEQEITATGSGGREFVSSTVSQEQLDAEIAKGV
jgi:hypothetical protein